VISIASKFLVVAVGLVIVSSGARADDDNPGGEAVKASIRKSLPLLELGAKGSLEQRKQCFNCHNQGLPMMALVSARARGFDIDGEHLRQQIRFTADFLGRNRQRYREGQGQGGQIDTAGYALWTLDAAGWQPDETTAAVAEYFLLYQQDRDYWESSSNRPPSEQSLFTSSYVALRGLKVFGIADQKERIDARIDQVRQWISKTLPQDTEDRVFRLRAVSLVGAGETEISDAMRDLLQTQRADGGWSQLPDLESDAYATGTALVALHDSGGLATTDPVYRAGLRYLIAIQHDDGSWQVTSRSKPFQTYFESGYPHGKDQFISIAAASWSTSALLFALPKVPVENH
jgi:squalene cyclase